MGFKIIFPPHPDTKIPPARLADYEKTGKWVAQRKYNGTHVLVYVSPQREVRILTRHGWPPKLFTLTKDHVRDICSLNLEEGKEYWLNGELLDHKTTTPKYKGKIVFFDILAAGKYLFNGPNQLARLELLAKVCRNPTQLEPYKGIALQVTDRIWMAETWQDNFVARYKDLITLPEIEGLILRQKTSVLDNFGQKEYQVPWILRVRKTHAGGNYDF